MTFTKLLEMFISFFDSIVKNIIFTKRFLIKGINMLAEVKVVLQEKLEQEMEGVSIYRARLDKKKIGGIAINTIYDIIKDNKKRLQKIHNNTILALLENFKIQWDEEYLQETGIVKLR